MCTLGSICEIKLGGRIPKENLSDNGTIPVIGGGTSPLGYAIKANRSGNQITISAKGVAGYVAWQSEPFWAYQNCYTLSPSSKINEKYLFYVLKAKQEHLYYLVTPSIIPSLSSRVLSRVLIPVPPIEVQEKIVSVLDHFTELDRELERELERKRIQYTYYRDLLLAPKPMQIKIMKLKDIATEIYRGNGIRRNDVTSDGIPCVRYGEIYTTYHTWFDQCVSHTKLECVSSPRYFEHGDILFAITGENIEDIAKSVAYIGNEKCLAGSDIVVMKHNQNPKYLAYALSTYEARKQKGKSKTKGKVVHSNIKSIENIEIPVPPLEIQQRIVDVLDNFESICNDLSIGLPTEITSRKAQYEYYRDALLNYAETGIYRTEQNRTDCTIRLIQYLFGYVKVELQTVGKVSMCKRILKSETSDTGDIPFYKIGTFGGKANAYISRKTFETYKHKYSFPKKGDVLISASGTIGRTVIYDGEDAYYQDSNIVWIDNDEKLILNRYLFYYYQLQPWIISEGGTISRLYNDNLSKTRIFIPSIEKQKEIINILDQFDSFCNGMTIEHPAKIKKRNHQYIEKLLNFEN